MSFRKLLSPGVQEAICLLLRCTGIPWFLREVYARRKVTIVNYHDPPPEVFERHMAIFARRYSMISIDELAEALAKKDFSGLPPKPMVVTLDDAHIGNADLFGIMKKYAIPAVIYAVAGVVDTNRGFWFDRLPHASAAMRRLKRLPDAERRAALERDFRHTDEREYGAPRALSGEQLREFLALGGTVGSHTVFHPLLVHCQDEVGLSECKQSRAILENLLQRTVQHFALPNGDADQRTGGWLTYAGYKTCRSTSAGWVTARTDPMALPNFGIADQAGTHKAVVQASGAFDLMKRGLRIVL